MSGFSGVKRTDRFTDLKEIVKLKAQLDQIPKDKLRQEGQQWVADFDIETSLNSANFLTFKMIVNGRRFEEDSVVTGFV